MYKFGEVAANIGRKIFDVVRNNVKVGVDISVKPPITNEMNYHVTSDQIADKVVSMMNKKSHNVVHPVYFMSDIEAQRVIDETNKR